MHIQLIAVWQQTSSEKVAEKHRTSFKCELWLNTLFWVLCVGIASITGNQDISSAPPTKSHQCYQLMICGVDAGLYSCSGPQLPIHQSFPLWKWKKVTCGNQPPAGSKCSPAAQHPHPPIRLHSPDPFSSATQCGALLLPQLVVSFHLQCSTWCQRRMDAEHRNGPEVPISLHGLYQSQMLPCISLDKTRSCRSTLSHSSKEGPVPTGPEQTMVQMMVTVGNSGVIYEGSSFPLWIANLPANERSVASVHNWKSKHWCQLIDYISAW